MRALGLLILLLACAPMASAGPHMTVPPWHWTQIGFLEDGEEHHPQADLVQQETGFEFSYCQPATSWWTLRLTIYGALPGDRVRAWASDGPPLFATFEHPTVVWATGSQDTCPYSSIYGEHLAAGVLYNITIDCATYWPAGGPNVEHGCL